MISPEKTTRDQQENVNYVPSLDEMSDRVSGEYLTNNYFTGSMNLNCPIFADTERCISMRAPILQNIGVGTARCTRVLSQTETYDNHYRLPLKHRSTITLWNGIVKERKDAANLVVVCPKHMKRYTVAPALYERNISRNDADQGEGLSFPTYHIKNFPANTNSFDSTGTQVSLIINRGHHTVRNMYNDREITGEPKFTKIIPFSYPDKNLSAQLLIDDTSSNILPTTSCIPVPVFKMTSPIKSFRNKNYNLSSRTAKYKFATEPFIPAIRASSGTIKNKGKLTIVCILLPRSNKPVRIIESSVLQWRRYPIRLENHIFSSYDAYEDEEYLNRNFHSSSILKDNRLLTVSSKLPKGLLNENLIRTVSPLTTRPKSIPPVFTGSIPTCSLHRQVNCQSSFCRAKSTYLLRRQQYYEAIMDQVHYIKSRIKTLNFTLKDVQQLFSLIEKANEDLVHAPSEPCEKAFSGKNKIKYEDFNRKLESNQTESQFTLDTIKQLEDLFDHVLMHIELCEKKYELKESQ